MSNKKLEVRIVALDKFTAPIRLFTRRINAIMAPIDRVSKDFDKLKRAAGGALHAMARPFKFMAGPIGMVGKAFRGVGGAIKHTMGQMGGLVGLGVAGFGIAGLIALTKGTSDYGDELKNAADRIGVTTGELEQLRYAAKMSDVEMEALEDSMMKFNRSIFSASAGKGKEHDLFASLGIDIKKNGKLRSAKDLMLEVSDVMARKIPNASMRAGVAFGLFGKGATPLINMLTKGKADLEKTMAERAGFGLFSEKDIEKAGRFDEAMKRTGTAMEALKLNVGITLLPALSEIMDKIRELVVIYTPQIKKFFEEFSMKLTPERIDAVFTGLQAGMMTAMDTLKALSAIITPLAYIMGYRKPKNPDEAVMKSGESYSATSLTRTPFKLRQIVPKINTGIPSPFKLRQIVPKINTGIPSREVAGGAGDVVPPSMITGNNGKPTDWSTLSGMIDKVYASPAKKSESAQPQVVHIKFSNPPPGMQVLDKKGSRLSAYSGLTMVTP